MLKSAIPPWQPEQADLETVCSRRRSLKSYRLKSVMPCVTKAGTSNNKPLPWAWLAMQAGQLFHPSAFNKWLCLRIVGRASFQATTCALCGDQHGETDCPAFLAALLLHGITIDVALEYPESPACFTATLRAIQHIMGT